MKITMIRKAWATPGTARASETMILLSDLIRLKRRKTRKARSMRSKPSGPSTMRSSESTPTVTTKKSKMFQPDFQNGWNQLPHRLRTSSTTESESAWREAR